MRHVQRLATNTKKEGKGDTSNCHPITLQLIRNKDMKQGLKEIDMEVENGEKNDKKKDLFLFHLIFFIETTNAASFFRKIRDWRTRN